MKKSVKAIRDRAEHRHFHSHAVGNDYGFDHIFERQVEAHGQKGDVAYGISTSGNSKTCFWPFKKPSHSE